MRTAAVTGARGYVGSTVADALRAAGWEVRAPTRAEVSLEHGGTFDGAELVVHCAWDFRARSRADIELVNVRGSIRLLEAAAAARARSIFVSTLSSDSLYAQAKRAVEPAADVVVRPGLVWGPRAGTSLYGTLRRLARLPLLPVFSRARLGLAHEDDLAALVVALAEGEAPDGPVVAAADERLTLAQILRRINPRAVTVPMPWPLVWAPLRVLELLGVRARLRSDSVLSLARMEETGGAHPPVPFRSFRP